MPARGLKMNEKQARELLLHTVVMDNDTGELGTVNSIGWAGVYVNWQNGKSGWIAYCDCKMLSLYQEVTQ